MSDGGRHTLYTDGAALGNPGHGGAGAVLLDGSGGTVFEVGVYLGRATNNVAEYQGLILGVERALAAGAVRLDIFMDSELVVRQLEGRYRVSSPALRILHRKALLALDRLEDWTASHVARAGNADADRMAGEAARRGRAGSLGVGEEIPAPPPA
ncbi:MAG: ribonuclease HI family protein [Deltaproteobacteria bacterium]|jgi:ribonuclease HI|nr:ribonuclease HI family protein [Deltaproteobacteria bacterium]